MSYIKLTHQTAAKCWRRRENGETWKTGATEHLPHDSVKLSFDFECRKWPKEFSGEWKSAPALCQMFCSSLSMLHVGCWMCARQMQLKRLNSLPRRLHYMGGMCVAFQSFHLNKSPTAALSSRLSTYWQAQKRKTNEKYLQHRRVGDLADA